MCVPVRATKMIARENFESGASAQWQWKRERERSSEARIERDKAFLY